MLVIVSSSSSPSQQTIHHRTERSPFEDNPSSFDQRTMEQSFGREAQGPRRLGQNSGRGYDSDQYDRDVSYRRPAPQNHHDHDHRQTTTTTTTQKLEYTTRTMRTVESRSAQDEEYLSLSDIICRMQGLSTRDVNYAVLYALCLHRFPEVAKSLTKPDSDMFRSTSPTPGLQTPNSNQPRTQPPSPVPANTNPIPPSTAAAPVLKQPQLTELSPEASAYFRPRIDGCVFCTQSGHTVRSCPGAMDYVNRGRAMIKNDRIHLRNGQPVPNDGTGRGLKHGIDTWIAANTVLVL